MAGSATRKFAGSRRTASARSGGRSNASLTAKRRYPYFAVCIDNHGYQGSLCVGRIYRIIKPQGTDRPADVRVIDEEGEDYLYSANQFVEVELPLSARRAVSAATTQT